MAAINATCPNCRVSLEIPAELAGQNIQCPGCGASFTVPVAAAMPQAVTPAAVTPQAAPAAVTPQAPDAVPASTANAAKAKLMSFLSSPWASGTALILGILALFLTVISLIYNIFIADKIPQIDFSKDPEDACINYLEATWYRRSFGDYTIRKNYKFLCRNLTIEEVCTNGNYAVVFYSIKKGASTHRDTIHFKRNSDGYYERHWDINDADATWAEQIKFKEKNFTANNMSLKNLLD